MPTPQPITISDIVRFSDIAPTDYIWAVCSWGYAKGSAAYALYDAGIILDGLHLEKYGDADTATRTAIKNLQAAIEAGAKYVDLEN